MSSFELKQLLLLFEHPQEPVFLPKDDKVFSVPVEFLSDRYQSLGSTLDTFVDKDTEKISLAPITIPNLGEVLGLPRDENFSLFVPKHRELADHFINILMDVRDVADFLSTAVYARDRVNPYLFNYCYSVALMHRDDTRGVAVPPFIGCFPDKYMDSKCFARSREQSRIVPAGQRAPIDISSDFTASDRDVEHRLAYFREDLGTNLHHWHWHLVYPVGNRRDIVAKDRRGELFYYMHQQIIARYNFERFCNGLLKVERLSDFNAPINEAYFPKLNSVVASRAYPARPEGQRMKDLDREVDDLKQDVDDLKRWSDRIKDAIHQGRVMTERGQTIRLTEFEGIDVLGNIVEASILSPNRTFYGDLHNMGHTFLAYIHDPDHRYLENFGVMGDVATAMRDPLFYRWHAYIDDIFQEHKNTLPSYEEDHLDFPGVTVSKVEIQSQGNPPNLFNTFWQKSDVNLTKGMDFQPGAGPIFVRFTHLQHQPFTYRIVVNNNNGGIKLGTLRIFLAPKFDEKGRPWKFRDQKLMFIELEKFVVRLKQGQNIITRSSTESSVTIPFDRTFRELIGTTENAQFNFCGCGWPHHLLIPKGTPEGMPCDLFVMISDYEADKIEQNIEGICNDSASFCGIKDRLYPDRRAMGYPFDRLPKRRGISLAEFLTPNMRVQNVTIRFKNRTIQPKDLMY